MYTRIQEFAYGHALCDDSGKLYTVSGHHITFDATHDPIDYSALLAEAFGLFHSLYSSGSYVTTAYFLYPGFDVPDGGALITPGEASAKYTYQRTYSGGDENVTSRVEYGSRRFPRWSGNPPLAFLRDELAFGDLENRDFAYDSDSSGLDDSGYPETSRVRRHAKILVPWSADWIGSEDNLVSRRWGKVSADGRVLYSAMVGGTELKFTGLSDRAVLSPAERFLPKLCWVPPDLLTPDGSDDSGSDEGTYDDALRYVEPLSVRYLDCRPTDSLKTGMRVVQVTLGDPEQGGG